MRTVALLCLVMVLACVSAYAQELNQEDPEAVARAYVDACEKWNVEAASEIVQDENEARALLRLLAEPGRGTFEQILGEMLCVPLPKHLQFEMGEVVTQGEECRAQVTVTYTKPATLVLRKGEDGKWRVALRETLLSTTGAAESMLLSGGPMSEQEACLSNLKQLGLGILQYAQDHDETLPPAETWCDAIFPYLKNESIFHCPSTVPDIYGYAFNAKLSKLPLARIDNPAETILLFESSLGTRNAAEDPAVAAAWAARHNRGSDVVYADGHAKWLRQQ